MPTFPPGIWSGPGTPLVCEDYGKKCCGAARKCGASASARRVAAGNAETRDRCAKIA